MRSDTFADALRTTGAYETGPATPRRTADRLLGRFDAWYYLRLLSIVAAAGRCARRGAYTREEYMASSLAILRLAEGCGGRVRIAGADLPLATRDPVVFVANHMSALETLLLPCMLALSRPYATIVKESLLRYPAFGAVLKALDSISVSRTDPREDLRRVLEGSRAAVGRGWSVLIFPQASRTTVFRRNDFNSLGVKVARAAGVCVMPVALRTDFFGIGKIVRDFGPLDRSKPILFRVGPPIPVEGTGKEAHARVVSFIAENLSAWGTPVE